MGKTSTWPLLSHRDTSRSAAMLPERLQAFTLVELLVVIGVISVLIAILMPALNKAREAAQAVACASNERQIGLAFQMYAQDYGGYLPAPRVPAEGWPRGKWYYKLQPYTDRKSAGTTLQNHQLMGTGLFRCPAKENWSLDGPADINRLSYAMNKFDATADGRLGFRPVKLVRAADYTNLGVSALSPTVRSLSQVVLLAENNKGEDAFANYYGIYSFPSLWHHQQDNILFCDGHVERVERWGLNYNLTYTK